MAREQAADGAVDAKPKRPPRARRSKVEQREETIQQILDAGEYLFSQRGFFGVTLKDIAHEVGVHTSLLHYYFEDKKSLFDQVIGRRIAPLNESRLAAMDRYEQEADEITVEGALHAFLDTNLDCYTAGQEWKYYGAISAAVNNTPQWGAQVMNENMDVVSLRLIGLLRRALPHCSDADLFWSYHFVSGALTLTLARTGRIDRLSDGACDSNDFAAIKARMARFMAAGFEELCRNPAKA